MTERDHSHFWPLSSAEELAEALREQGEQPDDIAGLLLILWRLREWSAPVPSTADTQRLIASLTPLAQSIAPVPTPPLSPVRRALRGQRIRNRESFPYWLLDALPGQVVLLQPIFWLASALIAVAGAVLMMASTSVDRVAVLRSLGPLIACIAITNVFRSSRLNVLEIELSCLLSPLRLILTRLFLVLSYDVAIGLVLSVILWSQIGSQDLLALTLHWLSPLLLVTGLALVLSNRLPVVAAIGIAYASWLFFLIMVIVEEQQGFFSNLVETGEVMIAAIGVVLVTVALLQLRTRLPRLLPYS